MVRDFKSSLFENTESKNQYHTETSQRARPTNQKPTKILRVNTNATSKKSVN